MDQDRMEIAAKVWDRTDLSMREVGDIVERSPAWVAMARHQVLEAGR